MKDLADLIAFNIAHADEELVSPFWTDQSQYVNSRPEPHLLTDTSRLSRFITSENTTVDQAFFDAVAADKDLGATRGIDATLKAFKLNAILLPTDVSSTPAAIAGYPIVTGSSAPPSTIRVTHPALQCRSDSCLQTRLSRPQSLCERAARTSHSDCRSWVRHSASSTWYRLRLHTSRRRILG